jgi:hypothetical protein
MRRSNMIKMKIFCRCALNCLIILIVVAPAETIIDSIQYEKSDKYIEKDNEKSKIKISIKGALGIEGGGEETGANIQTGLNIIINNYILSPMVEYAITEPIGSGITTYSLLGGKILLKDEWVQSDLLIGIGISNAKKKEYKAQYYSKSYERVPFYFLSVPVQWDIWLRPTILSKYIGVGVCINGNINSYMSYVGAMFNLKIGTLR